MNLDSLFNGNDKVKIGIELSINLTVNGKPVQVQ